MAKKVIKKTPFKEPFVIYQLPKTSNLREFNQDRKNRFISPVFGNDVVDEIVIPNQVAIEGDKYKRFGIFSRDNKLSDEEVKEKYGDKYYEFTNFINKKTRDQVYGKNHSSVNHQPLEEISNSQQQGNLANFERHDGLKTQEPIKTPSFVEVPAIEEDIPISTYLRNPESTTNMNDDQFHNQSINGHKDTSAQIKKSNSIVKKYAFPNPALYEKKALNLDDKPQWLLDQILIINQTLTQFGIEGEVHGSKKGPTVTRYEVALQPGINVKKVLQIQDNLMMNLSAKSMRIEAPIPGKPYVGIEVANVVPEVVNFGNVVDQKEFLEDHDHPLKVALGVDIDGDNIYIDIAKMPHGLIAGSTNSGKSVCVNTILVSLLIKNKPEDLKLILIDPKMVELATYNGLPHLITPVIFDARMAAQALNWAVEEMERRYRLFANTRTREIKAFNQLVKRGVVEYEKMPYLLIVIDELADLMNVAANEVEDSIHRLSAKARAAGIHLLVATQRPSTDVIKGTIKSNIPTRIAFRVASFVDSTTILDGAGAENLLGRGDMLLKEGDSIHRLQGAYISDYEIDATVDYIKEFHGPEYIFEHEDLKQQVKVKEATADELFEPVAYFVVELGNASINGIQKNFNIGFNRAQNLVELLEQHQFVSSAQATKAREVLATIADLDDFFGKNSGF